MIVTIEFMRKRDGELMALYMKPDGTCIMSHVGRKRIYSGVAMDPDEMGADAGYFGVLLASSCRGQEVIGCGLLKVVELRQIGGTRSPEQDEMHEFEFACAGLCYDQAAAVRVHRELSSTVEKAAGSDPRRNEMLFDATDDLPDLEDERPDFDFLVSMDTVINDGGEYVPGMERTYVPPSIPKRMLN